MSGGIDEVRRGLNMAHPPDPAKLAAEKAELARLQDGPAGPRVRNWLRLIGPGYLQSAMTLGGGYSQGAWRAQYASVRRTIDRYGRSAAHAQPPAKAVYTKGKL